MIMGVNTSIVHEGHEYHIQCEDLGFKATSFEIRVYDQGNILWQKRVPYQPVPDNPGSPEAVEALKEQQGKLVKTVQAAITQGKIKKA